MKKISQNKKIIILYFLFSNLIIMKALLNWKLFNREKVEVICHVRLDCFYDIFIEEICKTEKWQYVFVNWSTVDGEFLHEVRMLRVLSKQEVLEWYEKAQYMITNKERFFEEFNGKIDEI